MTRRLALVLLLFLTACSAHGRFTPLPPPPAAPITGGIAKVVVETNPTLPESRIERFRELDGTAVIQQAMIEALTASGDWDPTSGAVTLVVAIDVFRLRSTANAVINGVFAGIDLMEGTLEFRTDDGLSQRVGFKFSGSEDVGFKFSASARFRSLARALAKDTVGQVPRGG